MITLNTLNDYTPQISLDLVLQNPRAYIKPDALFDHVFLDMQSLIEAHDESCRLRGEQVGQLKMLIQKVNRSETAASIRLERAVINLAKGKNEFLITPFNLYPRDVSPSIVSEIPIMLCIHIEQLKNIRVLK